MRSIRTLMSAVGVAALISAAGIAVAGSASAADDYAGGWPTISAGAGGPHINVNVVQDGDWGWHDRSNPQQVELSTDYEIRVRVENFTYATLWSPVVTSNGNPAGGQDLRCDFSAFGGPVGVSSWPEGGIPHGGVFYCLATQLGRDDAGTIYSDYRVDGEIRPANGTPYMKWGADWWWGKIDATPSIDIEKWSTIDGIVDGDFDVAPGKSVQSGTSTPITMTITNTGNETLLGLYVSDETVSGPALENLSCDFSPFDGPSTGTDAWVYFPPNATLTCTGTIPALAAGEQHSDIATITAWSNSQLGNITDSDEWHGTGEEPTPEEPSRPGPSDEPTTPTETPTTPSELPTVPTDTPTTPSSDRTTPTTASGSGTSTTPAGPAAAPAAQSAVTTTASLPHTGTTAVALGAIALVLVVGGILAVALGKRRKND